MPQPRNGPSRTSRTGTRASKSSLLLAFLSAASASATTSSSTSTSSAATPTITLPSQVLQVVPACAIDCLATFVQNNFQGFKKDATACPGNTPSFSCLCEHTGANGFTLGEAAISCLTLEAGAGSCTSTGKFADAFADVKRAAYLMCASAATSESFTAAEQTHRTIVATAVVGSEFARNDAETTTTTTATTRSKTSTHHGFSTITTGTLTGTSTTKPTSTTKSTSSSKAQTLTISATSLPTTLITAPPPASKSTTTFAASATSSPATTSSSTTGNNTTSSSSAPLSTGQIVGISVGAAAALIAAVCLYFGLRWFRKRRDRESDFFGDTSAFPGHGGPTGGGSPKTDTTGFTRLPELNFNTVSSTASTRNKNKNVNGHEMQISAPMHLQQPQRYQNQSAFVSPWQDKQETLQTRNPYAQQTAYTVSAMPTIRPVNNTPSLMTNTRQDAYSQPAPARVLTLKTLPSRPSQSEPSQSQSPQSSLPSQAQPQSYSRPQYQPAKPQNNYSRPALPADWRPRPPQQQQQSQRRPLPPLQPPYPASLQTMAEEDEDEDEDEDDANPNSRLPPLPPQKSQAIFGPPVPNRDSVVTEFAEDGEDEYSLRTSGRASGRTSRPRESGGQIRQTQYSAAAGNPYDEYMSPTLVPRPLAAQAQVQRSGDDRPPALVLGTSRPRQNWQRMNSVIL